MMTVEEVKDLIEEKLASMVKIQENLARDETPLSGWSWGYITALSHLLKEIEEQENES